MSWKPCMSFSVDPIAVPSAANTMAIKRHEDERQRHRRQAVRPESGHQADDQNQRALDHRDRRAAERASEHDLQPRHRRNQRLLEETELAIPQQADAREDRREQDAHPDDARRDELQVASLPRLLEDRTEAEAEHEQVQQRLPSDAMICGRDRR